MLIKDYIFLVPLTLNCSYTHQSLLLLVNMPFPFSSRKSWKVPLLEDKNNVSNKEVTESQKAACRFQSDHADEKGASNLNQPQESYHSKTETTTSQLSCKNSEGNAIRRQGERRGAICKELEKNVMVCDSVSLYLMRTEVIAMDDVLRNCAFI